MAKDIMLLFIKYLLCVTVKILYNIHVSVRICICVRQSLYKHSGPTEVEDCSLPPPNMAATKTGEQGKA